ncbi:S-adenosyl-dependent methyl transferase [Buchnera aphidicola (Cinara tujafilina)]|uniref:Ribosomal RNA small subunit methyltransferase H n=1 Tax=Buchnera aphidicola (Cinara tujafilina) TaxID=261317 RepID=F7WZ76_9GAMM|nr:16S rRNA (cytosine(1402)-N(4))-methyltransferase RsmH [Buchnera aphidicola]AEH39730.1 S-adenosyl-dependent methyl transferase [Buchnera aphidicola (Cinara tujafilina)]
MIHKPVLTKEIIQYLKIKKDGTYVDCTFGGGGHSKAILQELGVNGKLYSIDQDPQSIKIGKKIKDSRFKIFLGKFSNIEKILKKEKNRDKIDGILLDLGISSIQLNSSIRGFSFMNDGPLDMRMNPKSGISVSQWLKKTNQKTIEQVIKNFGEEKYAKKISRAIILQIKKKTITSTLELVQIIKKSIPKYDKFKHPATRTFQAFRIYINQEINELHKILKIIINILHSGSKIAIISFHSIEDRIVKNFIKNYSNYPNIPKKLPITELQIRKIKKKIRFIKRIKPNISEIQKNPRARSAILRICEIR